MQLALLTTDHPAHDADAPDCPPGIGPRGYLAGSAWGVLPWPAAVRLAPGSAAAGTALLPRRMAHLRMGAGSNPSPPARELKRPWIGDARLAEFGGQHGLALKNWCSAGTPALDGGELGFWNDGGMWSHGMRAGGPVDWFSSGPGFTHHLSDLTKCFNRPSPNTPSNALLDIRHASRSVVRLDGDLVVVYDRATSLHAGLFKRFHLDLARPPAIRGNTVTQTFPNGERLILQSLLPSQAAMTCIRGVAPSGGPGSKEPFHGRIVVEDPWNPTDVRLLHTLQRVAPCAPMLSATRWQSSGGAAFDGVAVGRWAVFFQRAFNPPATTTTFEIAPGVDRVLVVGLMPGSRHEVTVRARVGRTLELKVGGGGRNEVADASGVLDLEV